MVHAWRIVVADGMTDDALARLRQQAEVVEAGVEAAAGADALIVRGRSRVTAEVLAAGRPRLRVVGRAGVGVDNIDLEAARRLDVVVVHAPLAATISVAEHTLALMLALVRHVPAADAGLRRGEWGKAGLEGRELFGKTLGLVGFGRVGRAVGQRAAALGMRLLAFDPLLPADAIRQAGAQPVDLDTLLAESDVVSVHVPLEASTRHLLGAAELGRMRPGAQLIHTSRGGIVDEEALLHSLEAGRLAGAALDVFETEPPGRTGLIAHPAVVVTPHIAAQTAEAQARASADIAAEVLAALRGDPLRWRVA
ncbi:MAG TPA: hydroxyacid dehydrogenase [Anaerolineales bacterium]|nr:hydroxyacid dehydrogenase [Anaerolineales bacterium]